MLSLANRWQVNPGSVCCCALDPDIDMPLCSAAICWLGVSSFNDRVTPALCSLNRRSAAIRPPGGADHADHHVAAFAAPHLLHLMQRAVGLIQQTARRCAAACGRPASASWSGWCV
ncbi:hypothetical protein J4732_05350 [Serratia marcescens]|uniref:Uncharacterized protein n=1 Tax=Serratia marcescens TaxID=615 RepID=A0A939NSV1_SERMA|nr:hypothetical protein [Serratia marcescens]